MAASSRGCVADPDRRRAAGVEDEQRRGGRARAARCAPRRRRRRAVARQSIERTSSPTTYSRSESNSVPWPRTCDGGAARRARAAGRAATGRCLREVNGGSTRSRHGTVVRRPAGRRARAGRPSGSSPGRPAGRRAGSGAARSSIRGAVAGRDVDARCRARSRRRRRAARRRAAAPRTRRPPGWSR